ncbi:hypothetical protein ACRARG_02415 [Pseudooceanicola sp. C21-150M6]|uniref:hypothetical protein n=1 Tax=Pseudooceanicola sp. C21-150M6 TaxID=3434355 RepID=UPI003D7FF431
MSDTAHGIGHNNGPAMDAGRSFRVYRWAKAKANRPSASVTPHVIRRRVTRAKELGLSYAAYASLLETAGRDVGGFLMSANALQLRPNRPEPPERILDHLAGLRNVERIALIPRGWPLPEADVFDAIYQAPTPMAAFPRIRMAIAQAQDRRPAASLVVIGMGLEREWVSAGRLGGFLEASEVFPAA